MARSSGTDKLVCQHGYFRWTDWQLCRMPGSGFALVAPCEFGDHYLAPESGSSGTGRLAVGMTAHAWPSSVEALAARDAWRLQGEGQG
jgi:hypothetical protein